MTSRHAVLTKRYKPVLLRAAFRDAFYEFISCQSEPKVQAAVRLMGRLAQREDNNLKRFHAILANPLMRKDVFWF